MKHKTNFFSYILVLFTLAFSSTAYSWKIEADFESAPVGSTASGTDAFSDPFATVLSNVVSAKGNQSAEASISAGDQGFGRWGGQIDFEHIKEGEEIWLRAFIYYPAGFDFTATGVGVKTLRIHTRSATPNANGTINEGYFDLLSNGSSGITVASEIHPEFFENNSNWKNIGKSISKGQWHAYEQYVKFSSIPGQGIYRAWQDGKLVLEDKVSRTLRSATSKADFIYIWSYWNGNAPKTQKAYIDNIVITNEPPATKDSNNNPFIGLGDVQLISAPKPPSISQ